MEPERGRAQRVAAGVVAIAVSAWVVWLVATGGWFWSTPTPTPTPTPTEPPTLTETPPLTGATTRDVSARVGFVGLPPDGSTPSRPESGELVLSYFGQRFTHWYQVWVYEDGRLIWQREGDLREGANEYATGFLEQRLTPEGVELLLRRGSAEAALFGFPWRPPYPASWLPPRVWEDPAIRAYVPSRYAVCYAGLWRPIERSRILTWLPASASELLRDGDTDATSIDGWLRRAGGGCSGLTADDARAVAGVLEDAGFERDAEFQEMYALTYYFQGQGAVRNEAAIRFEPILPHGEAGCSGCG